MERLVQEIQDGILEMICRWEDCHTSEERCYVVNDEKCKCMHEVLSRLKKYEDTGLEPEQIYELGTMYKELCEKMEALKKRIPPCEIGDYIWDIDFGSPYSYEVTGFSFGDLNDIDYDEQLERFDCLSVYYRNSSGSITGSFEVSEIGKTVFLSESEAREALKRKRYHHEP